MINQKNDMKLISSTIFKLLPIQILLASINSFNELISSFFANNYVGSLAMTAVGLYNPIYILILAPNTMLLTGAAILAGKYWGQNDQKRLQEVFSTSIIISFLIGVFFILLLGFLGFFGLTGFITTDKTVAPIFNEYLLVQCIGIIPLVLGTLMSTFLSLENKGSRTIIATISYIVFNFIFHYIFVFIFKMEASGLSLASALANWVFFFIISQYFFTKKAHLRFSIKNLSKRELTSMMYVGYPKLLCKGYQTARGFILNLLLGIFVGAAGISGFAISRNIINFFWAVILGMLTVARMMISISVGEEDKQTLINSVSVMFRKFFPILVVINLLIYIFAEPIIKIFFSDFSDPAFKIAVWGLRIYAIYMPITIFSSLITCYEQVVENQNFVNSITILEELILTTVLALILIPTVGVYGVFLAFLFTYVILLLYMFIYAWVKQKKFPKDIETLLIVPKNFGAKEEDRMDITIKSIQEVVTIAEQIQPFCLDKGIDKRRSYIAALVLEEMAGNIIKHGFNKDKKSHYVEIRIVYKDDNLILRLKDNCIPFDPKSRQQLTNSEDVTKNIGLRIVFKIAKDIQYQNILGLNSLTIKI